MDVRPSFTKLFRGHMFGIVFVYWRCLGWSSRGLNSPHRKEDYRGNYCKNAVYVLVVRAKCAQQLPLAYIRILIERTMSCLVADTVSRARTVFTSENTLCASYGVLYVINKSLGNTFTLCI